MIFFRRHRGQDSYSSSKWDPWTEFEGRKLIEEKVNPYFDRMPPDSAYRPCTYEEAIAALQDEIRRNPTYKLQVMEIETDKLGDVETLQLPVERT